MADKGVNKGFTLLELIGVLVLILIIIFILSFVINGNSDTHCYYSSKGIICTYGEIGSDK